MGCQSGEWSRHSLHYTPPRPPFLFLFLCLGSWLRSTPSYMRSTHTAASSIGRNILVGIPSLGKKAVESVSMSIRSDKGAQVSRLTRQMFGSSTSLARQELQQHNGVASGSSGAYTESKIWWCWNTKCKELAALLVLCIFELWWWGVC